MIALSIVVPCFNEEACLADAARAAERGGARSAVGEDYEIVLVNDGSRDGSWADDARDGGATTRMSSRSTCRATMATSSR